MPSDAENAQELLLAYFEHLLKQAVWKTLRVSVTTQLRASSEHGLEARHSFGFEHVCGDTLKCEICEGTSRVTGLRGPRGL